MKKVSCLKLILAFTTSTVSLLVNATDITQGNTKANQCAGCHGINGLSLGEEYPNLAGQKKRYLKKQLLAFKNKKRVNAIMNVMAQNLTNTDIEDLSQYFSQLIINEDNIATIQQIIESKNKMTALKPSTKEFPETVFSSMKGSATIKMLPSGVTTKGGESMLYTAITPNGKILLSTSPSTNTLYVFDSRTMQQLAIIKVGKSPKGVKVMPNGKFAYVSNQGSNDISIIDLLHLKKVETINTPAGPHNVRFNQNGKIAYVTLQGGAGIGVINTNSRTLVKVIAVDGITGPHNLDLSLDEKTAFIRDFVHHVAVVDLSSEKVVRIITVGNGHGGIDVDPQGKFVATAAIADDHISIINTKTLAVRNINLGTASHGIRASKNSQWLYVTLPKENTIAVINTNTWQVEKKIAVGKFPFWLAVMGNP